jgi:hypothetical protein
MYLPIYIFNGICNQSKKEFLLRVSKLLDHWPLPRGLFCQEPYWLNSDFLAFHLFFHASLIFEIMKVSAGWQRCVVHGGKYLKVVLFSAKTMANRGVMLCLVQLSTQMVFVRL